MIPQRRPHPGMGGGKQGASQQPPLLNQGAPMSAAEMMQIQKTQDALMQIAVGVGQTNGLPIKDTDRSKSDIYRQALINQLAGEDNRVLERESLLVREKK